MKYIKKEILKKTIFVFLISTLITSCALILYYVISFNKIEKSIETKSIEKKVKKDDFVSYKEEILLDVKQFKVYLEKNFDKNNEVFDEINKYEMVLNLANKSHNLDLLSLSYLDFKSQILNYTGDNHE